MKHIPLALIYFRVVMGLLLLLLSLLQPAYYAMLAVPFFTAGLLSDIFDGIIARRLKVSTEKLRRLDSAIDQLFWCLVAASAFIRYPGFFLQHAAELGVLILAEMMIYLICFAKFRKEVATHAISSKLWVLVLFATLVEVMSSGSSGLLFQISIYMGLLTRLEIAVIILLIREWTNDVPSVYHALRLRKGKTIKRHALFNG